MNTNETFLEIIRASFKEYLEVGTSRSTKKLKPLHSAIARDLSKKFGSVFQIFAQGLEGDNGKETKIEGRYYPKTVDITIAKNGVPVAGYAVKFVVRNYAQNSNNYFENMLGETANIRSEKIPYFQIFIIFDKVPYYTKDGNFKRYDIISANNLHKYVMLSKDDPATFFHTPDKTLFILLHLKEKKDASQFKNEIDYKKYYLKKIKDKDLIEYAKNSSEKFDNGIILNDYEDFIDRTFFITQGRLKK